MGLGTPSRIIEVWDENGTRMAYVDAAGEIRVACLSYLPDLGVGDYAVVHAGFALLRLDAETVLAPSGAGGSHGAAADDYPELGQSS